MMKQTEWKRFKEHDRHYRIRATYGIDYDFASRNQQAPHFSMTKEQERLAGGWREDSYGAAHEDIVRHFPALRPYVKWHLVSTDGPMHYLANAKYWWEIATGKRAPAEHQRVDSWDAFRNTIVFGALSDDAATIPDSSLPWEVWESWLEVRLPRLLAAFERDMKVLEVWEG